MSAEAFNSVGGYSVGLPPQKIIDQYGDVRANSVYATDFYGTFHGSSDFSINVPDSHVIFSRVDNNNVSILSSSDTLKFDYNTNSLLLDGSLVASKVTMGHGVTQFSTTEVLLASSNTDEQDQVLFASPVGTICSIDYMIVATDKVANRRQTSKIFASVLGEEVGYYEFGTIDVPIDSPGVGDFKVRFQDGQIQLTVNPLSSNYTEYKIAVVSYKE